MSTMLVFFLGAVSGGMAAFAGCAVAYLHNRDRGGQR